MNEITRVFIWRSRARGFLVVTAKSLDEAYDVIDAKQPGWSRLARAHEPEASIPARAGELAYLAQR